MITAFAKHSWQICCARDRNMTLALTVAMMCLGTLLANADEGTQSIRFTKDWRFTKGDPAAAETVDFDDSKWNTVRLPHDWAIAGPFNPDEDGYAGKLPWKGVGWYRKEFTLDWPAGSRIYLDFDGVMAFPQVYINGQLAGKWDYGYTSFRVDATDYVNLSGKNVIAVRADTTNHGTRWYPGAGIYRKVMLEIREPIHIAPWGVCITTPKVTDDSATIDIAVQVENHKPAEVSSKVTFTLIDASGNDVASASMDGTIAPGDSEFKQTLTIADPQRWDVDHPHLYRLTSELIVDGKLADSQATSLGIRTIEFTADDGFHLNGRRVQLQGVNLHHDLGPLGAAFSTRAAERQLQIMKSMGVNALRTSHNPPAPEVLDLCDSMGILVWDECFDKWDRTADRIHGKPSLQEHGERHLRSMVLRDRNHPSIIVWSIGNEIPDNEEGVTPERVKLMAEIVRKYDTSRPTTIGTCFPHQVAQGVYDSLDVVGWNYLRRYANHRKLLTEKPILYSESASTLSSRGFYALPLAYTKTDYNPGLQVSSYDLNAAAWSDIPEVEFDLMKKDPFVAGEFVWTGFDYLGEPTPYSHEAKSSYFGIVDLCGIPKDRYWLYRSYWNPEELTVHITPHWNWPDHVGAKVPVFVYTNGDSAELFLNGQSLGRQEKGVRSDRQANLAVGKQFSASSTRPSFEADLAGDDDMDSKWSAENDSPVQWLQVDLGKSESIKCIVIEFEKEAKWYGYELQVSPDMIHWETVARKPVSDFPQWGGSTASIHKTDIQARYARIEFDSLSDGNHASISEFAVYPDTAQSMYYDSTYDYRLRWNDVTYEPGELKVVAYKDGKQLGTARIKTAGEPAKIRLTPDRTRLDATGDDLCYVLVEALDKDGVLCPLAENQIRFQVEGPADIAAVGNGNPMSQELFQTNSRRLFYGKAMLIVRANEGHPGQITVTADADDLEATSISISSNE
ncbi:glycoside hydrolase family 2 TIM barrel-domain containing protein [Bythopirellula goksoeyrii]|nr:glycoside hydrolase family 2 TIM barrel-domain containing protein [Bythopirellula goksoeyrii]